MYDLFLLFPQNKTKINLISGVAHVRPIFAKQIPKITFYKLFIKLFSELQYYNI